MKKDETVFGRTERSIKWKKDGGGCGCDCVPATDIRDRGLERDTFIGWVTERRNRTVCGLVKSFILACLKIGVCCPYLAFINVVLSAHLFSAPCWWPYVSEFEHWVSGSILSSSNLRSWFHGANINSKAREINKSWLLVCSRTPDTFPPQCHWRCFLLRDNRSPWRNSQGHLMVRSELLNHQFNWLPNLTNHLSAVISCEACLVVQFSMKQSRSRGSL